MLILTFQELTHMIQSDEKSIPATATTTTPAAAASSKTKAKPVSKPKLAKPAAKKAVAKVSVTKTVKSKTTSPAAAKTVAVAAKLPSPKEPVADKPAKAKKVKLVRDSFTMPENEYALFAALKKRCIVGGIAVKKSELLRAALITLAALNDASLLRVVKLLPPIKTGRPLTSAK
jgi:hypothetical protein